MKIRIKSIPKPEMQSGGVFMNSYPWAGALSPNPLGLMNTDNSNLDESINDSIKPIDKDKANLEAEKGEVLFKFDAGGIFKIQGKKHSKGGTPLKADVGDFIFSDNKDLAIDKDTAKDFDLSGVTHIKKDNTPAKVLAKNVDIKQYNKFLVVLNNPKATDLEKKTAQLMLSKYMEKIGQVGFIQESLKNFPTGAPEFSQNTAPIYAEGLEDSIEAVKQYRYGGKYYDGGETDPKNGNRKVDDYGNTFVYDGESKAWVPDAQWMAKYNEKSGSPLDPYPGDKTKPISKGALSFNGSNKSKYSSKEWDAIKQELGYTGPNNNKKFQQYLMSVNPDLVNHYHSKEAYGLPNAKKPDDGILGIRWDYIVDDLRKLKSLKDFNPGNPNITNTVPTVPIIPNAVTGNPAANAKPKVEVPNANPITKTGELEQFKGFNIGMNGIEGLSVALPGLIAASMKSFYDPLIQKHSPDVRLDRVDNQAEINDIQQANSLSKREMFGNMDPRIAAMAAASADSAESQNIMRSNANKNQTNIQIGNQETMTNFQQDQQDQLFNLGQIQQTGRNNMLTEQRRQEMSANGLAQVVNNYGAVDRNLQSLNQRANTVAMSQLTNAYYDANGNYLGQASDFTDPATGRLSIPDDIQNRIAKTKQMPTIGIDKNRNPYFTGFGSLNNVRSNPAQTLNSSLLSTLAETLKNGDPSQRLDAARLAIMMNKASGTGNTSPMDEMMSYSNPAILAMMKMFPGGQ